MTQHVLRNTAATISATFQVDGTATDPSPDTATVGITREDGTVLVAPATVTTNAGTGIFSYTLTPAHTAALDVLKVTWTATLSGYSQSIVTYVEIVGGFVCSISDINAQLDKGGTASAYSQALKAGARAVATAAFEAEAGCAFTPRYKRVKLNGQLGSDVLLRTPQLRTVTAVTLDDTALTAPQLTELESYPEEGLIYNPAGWTTGRRNVEVKYEHGYETPPPDVSDAVAVLAASLIKDGPFDDRGYGVTDEGGAVKLLTAGISGASFSIPSVQAALARHRFLSVA